MSSTFIEETLQRPDRIINQYNLSGAILRDEVELLCSSASSPNPKIARAGISAIFTELVERLNDAFNPEYCILYDNVFSQVIDFFRKLPDGKNLDDALNNFGIYNEEDMLRRKRLGEHAALRFGVHDLTIKKIILLSRVTIGADVAVTSIAISKLRKKFPEAEYVILGSAKLGELFGGDPLIRIRDLKYERGGTVISRLNSWLSVLDAINDELRDVTDDQYLIIDPDSRLTQLGLLPVVPCDRNYYFFESRKYNRDGFNTIAELMSSWTGEIFSITDPAYPFVALLPDHIKHAKSLTEKLRGTGADKIVTVSFGTGDNPNKRVSESFEIDLVKELLADNVAVILDKGASQNERDQVNSILAQIQENFSSKIITWDGSIGVFAALIKSSDGYIGYDSSGQHIAAALAVPVLTIFVNYNTPVFAERWRPFGSGYIKTILKELRVES